MSAPPPLTELSSVLQELQMAGSSPRSRGVTDSSGSGFSLVEHPNQSSPPSSQRGESPILSNRLSSASLSSQRKFRLWRVPLAYEKACYRLIGQGASFCIQQDFCTNHKSTKQFEPSPGEIYVLKSPTSAFCGPSINSELLGEDLFGKWERELCSLDEWSHRFRLVQLEHKHPVSRDPDQKISLTDLDAKKEQEEKLKNFKTPAKKRRKVTEDQFQ